MKLVPVKSIPETGSKKDYEAVKDVIDEFIHSGNTYVKVVDDSGAYANHQSRVATLRTTIIRCGYNVKILQRGEDIYLAKI